MAAHGSAGVELGTGVTVDFAAHERTYRGFLTLLKYCTAGIAALLILMAFFLI
jgi:hypothetical protein